MTATLQSLPFATRRSPFLPPIEFCFVEALCAGFDQEKEATGLTIAQVLAGFVPLSKLMAEQISGLGNWAKGRARCATFPLAEDRRRRLVA